MHWLAQQMKPGEDLTEFTDWKTIGHVGKLQHLKGLQGNDGISSGRSLYR